MLTINTNLASLVAQSSLKSSTNKLNQAIERMTTGFKINHASDNAANYSITTNMSTKISAYEIAEDNVAMGLDMIETAVSNIDIVQSHAERIRALCGQAANGTYGSESLSALQKECDSLMSEIKRILSSAEYNGIALYQESSVTESNSGFLADITRLSAEEAEAQGYTLVTTADELIDALENSKSFCLMNDIDVRGYSWQETLGTYSGTIEGNGYKIYNIASLHFDQNAYGFLFNNAEDIVIKNLELNSSTFSAYSVSGIAASLSGKNVIDNVIISGSYRLYAEFAGICNELTSDSSLIIKNAIVDTDSYPLPSRRDGFVNNLGAASKVTIENSFFNSETIPQSDNYPSYGLTSSEIADLERGKIYTIEYLDKPEVVIQAGINSGSLSQITFQPTIKIPVFSINCTTSEGALSGLTEIDNFINALSEKSVELGAAQNRLESALEEISTQYENLVTSRSTLRDADIAEVSSEYIKQQILQQASATLLATANQTPALALQLL